MLRILHIGNTVGVPSIIAKAMNDLGHEAKVLVTWKTDNQFTHDYENYYSDSRVDFNNILKILRTVKLASDFDIVHFHSGINWKRLDFLMLKFLYHKPLVVHYHGTETRNRTGIAYRNLIDAKIIVSPDLLKWLPDAFFVPNPIMQLPYSFDLNKRPTILHMPSNRTLKGTDLILQAIEELRREDLDFDFRLVENVSHSEALRQISNAHIIIDQIVDESNTGIPGLFGKTSLEALAMGKVSMCHLSPEMLKYYPECPIINVDVNKEDLMKKIRHYIENLQTTRTIGIKGVAYVQKHHNPVNIAQSILNVYEKIM